MLDSHVNQSTLDGFDLQICQNQTVIVYIWCSSSVVLFTVGATASFSIIFLYVNTLRRGTILTPKDIFIFNLAIMDFLFFLVLLPGLFNRLFLHNWTLEMFWTMGFTLCMTGKPLLMVGISLDCVMAILYPIAFSRAKSLTPRIVSVSVAWLMMLASMVSFHVTFGATSHRFRNAILLMATLVILSADFFLIFQLFKSMRGKKGLKKQKRKAVCTVVNSLLISIVSFIPPLVISSTQQHLLRDNHATSCTLHFLMVTSFTLGSALMPTLWICDYIYTTHLKKDRK